MVLAESPKERQLPPLLTDEFRFVNRYWDNSNSTFAAKITPGEYYVTKLGEVVTTVLGSCVSACIRDTHTGVGGMNHFMLPREYIDGNDWVTNPVSQAARYGNVAMERLINTIMSAGGRRERLECKIFGGAHVLNLDSEIGAKNIEFVMRYLMLEGIEIKAKDVGGPYPRKLLYFPKSGQVRMKRLRRIQGTTLQRREQAYSHELAEKSFANEVTLFREG